jgi:outer membrane protein assembly factor BamB
MKTHLISLLILFLLLFTSFSVVSNKQDAIDSNAAETPRDGGLMNSSWPMFHHDVRHTGRSPYSPVGTWPSVKWQFWMAGRAYSSPALDKNGTIYIGARDFVKSFFAINPNGTEKWNFNSGGWIDASPAIDKDGIIYSGSMNGDLHAFFQNGSKKWSTHLGAGWVYSSPVIGTDGTIYAASVGSGRLVAVYPNGTIRWYFNAEDYIYCSPAIANDGTIYVGSNDGYMYAVYPNGTLRWKFYAGGEKGIGSAPSIADDETIYFGGTSGYLYALYPNGTLRWKIGTGYIGTASPAIHLDGTIYIGTLDNYRMYSINPNGSVDWYYTTYGEIYSSPVIDKFGIIYCGSDDGYLYAFHPDGSLFWKFHAGEHVESSPVIGEDGTIYIAAYSGLSSYLYALGTINNTRPSTPTIDGTASGKINQNYEYTIVSTDPDGNNISYYVAWGDGISTGWFGPFPSGEEQTVSHTWIKKGTYTIRVWAMDNYSAESDPGTLSVTMPYKPPQFLFLEWLLERFPNAFPILRYLLGYNH